MPPTPIHGSRAPRGLRPCLLALFAAWLLCGGASAAERPPDETRSRRVPAEMRGAWCPAGGCETRAAGLWDGAAFATALGAVVLLARRPRDSASA